MNVLEYLKDDVNPNQRYLIASEFIFRPEIAKSGEHCLLDQWTRKAYVHNFFELEYSTFPQDDFSHDDLARLEGVEYLILVFNSQFRNFIQDDHWDLLASLHPNVLDLIKNEKIKLLFSTPFESFPEALYQGGRRSLMYLLHQLIKKHGIQPGGIFFALPDYKFGEGYDQWCRDNKEDQCLVPIELEVFQKDLVLRTKTEEFTGIKAPWDRDIEKKFLLLCARPHDYRVAIFHDLYNQGRLDRDFFYSFLLRDRNKSDLIQESRGNVFKFIEHCDPKFEEFLKNAPYYLDFKETSSDGDTCDKMTPSSFINKSGIHIVLETDLTADNYSMFLTEKTFKPILFGQVFMIFGPPRTLEFLRNLGYQTFPEIIDETYDEILDADLRYGRLLSEITRLSEMDHQEFLDLIGTDQVFEKLKHNQRIFMEERVPSDKNWTPK